ncbi:MAG TPA: folylpolyglutamate synthase/dihydrofolate synthase family protein [Dehalococcoidia bacterium]|nr:folylpolyglutamate synthase/dihydrofolate synthase family protein [Dehalococcoidia bacterium]
MHYAEALDYILSFADFERSGRFRDRPDVAPMLALLRGLVDPHLGRATVHVAGSKGKGSVAAMVDSALRAAGLSSGLYTSPHLHSYCERVRLDGEPLSEERFAHLTGALREAAEADRQALAERQLVTFDLLTALAFLAFRETAVQAQVLEVGLGGRLDSTNVFETKDVAVVTPISLEHTAILGDTVAAIAREKAAIVRPGCTVVLAPQPYAEAASVVREFAAAAGAPVIDVAGQYRWRKLSHDRRGQEIVVEGPHGAVEARLSLLGAHQVENAATAVACLDALSERHPEWDKLTVDASGRGLAHVTWPGRLEVLRERPLVVADGAHNRDSARRLREALSDYFACPRAVLIVGISADKDVAGLAAELAPIAARAFAVQARHPRAMAAGQVAAGLAQAGVDTVVAGSTGEALERAVAVGGGRGVICVLGSLFVVAEAREHILKVAAGDGG